jgi:hypothetical protein
LEEAVAEEEAVEEAGENFRGEVAVLVGLGDRGGEGLGGLLVDLAEGLVQGLAVFGGELAGFADEGMDEFLVAIEGLEAGLAVGGEGFGEGCRRWKAVGGCCLISQDR